MKLRNISLLAIFTTICAMEIQAEENNPFAPKNPEDHAIALAKADPLPSPATSAPIIAPASLVPTPAEPTNPFALASHTTITAPASHDEPANLEDHAIASAKADEEPANPFAPHMAEPEHHETAKSAPSMHQGHVSTAHRTASIKTIHITPGHSATLEPITITHGIEAERYFVQDKKYESYLSSHINPTERSYTVTIPATVHVGSFTVFKVHGMHGTPDHLEPAYHVEIQGNLDEMMHGTQYPEPQGSAVEKLTQLENKYLTGIQTQFKAFTQEVRELISTAHANGESLETAKLQATQTIATKEPLHLAIGESHIATSFTGGSAQSSNPTIVSAVLTFKGTKTAPQWKLVLTGHKVGEAIITYSTGSESHLQPVIVGETSSSHHTSEHTTVEKEAALNHPKDSVKSAPKKENHALPLHPDDQEESQEKNDKKSVEEGNSPEETSEEVDEKTAAKLSREDEPFASFLKESPDEKEAASSDADSSEHQAEPTESEPTVEENESTPEESEEAQEEDK